MYPPGEPVEGIYFDIHHLPLQALSENLSASVEWSMAQSEVPGLTCQILFFLH